MVDLIRKAFKANFGPILIGREGAKTSTNKVAYLPYEIALKRCAYRLVQHVVSAAKQFTSNFNVDTRRKRTELSSLHHKNRLLIFKRKFKQVINLFRKVLSLN